MLPQDAQQPPNQMPGPELRPPTQFGISSPGVFPPVTPEPQKSGGKKKYYIGLIVLILIAAAAAAFFISQRHSAKPSQSASTKTVTQSSSSATNDNSGSTEYTGSETCDNSDASKVIAGYVTVSSIDTKSRVINFSPTDQTVTDDTGNPVATINSKNYDSNTLFCNGDQPSSPDAISANKEIVIYLGSVNDATLARVNIY